MWIFWNRKYSFLTKTVEDIRPLNTIDKFTCENIDARVELYPIKNNEYDLHIDNQPLYVVKNKRSGIL